MGEIILCSTHSFDFTFDFDATHVVSGSIDTIALDRRVGWVSARRKHLKAPTPRSVDASVETRSGFQIITPVLLQLWGRLIHCALCVQLIFVVTR